MRRIKVRSAIHAQLRWAARELTRFCLKGNTLAFAAQGSPRRPTNDPQRFQPLTAAQASPMVMPLRSSETMIPVWRPRNRSTTPLALTRSATASPWTKDAPTPTLE